MPVVAEAETAYQKALTLRRQFAQRYSALLSDVARTLHNLGSLYSETHRFAEAEAAYQEALALRRQVAQEQPGPPHP